MKFSFRTAPAVEVPVAPLVLLVGSSPDSEGPLRNAILDAVTGVRIESVASVNDLVFRLADPGAAAVVIDGAHVPDLLPTLMPLLCGLAPRLQSVLVHDAPDAEAAGEHCVAPGQLGDWLREHLAGAPA